jgi:hypothetical protein
MKIIDNALSPSVFKMLEDTVLHYNFPWHFSPITYPFGTLISNNPHPFNFTNYPIVDGQPQNDFGILLQPILLDLIDKMGHSSDTIFRVRLALQPRTLGQYTNDPHIDLEFPHRVGILYLTDSNSPTVLYNEKYDFNLDKSKYADFAAASYGYYKNNYLGKETVLEKVMPKRNRLLSFDGGQYHASATPDDVDRRVIINFTYGLAKDIPINDL